MRSAFISEIDVEYTEICTTSAGENVKGMVLAKVSDATEKNNITLKHILGISFVN